MSSPDTASYMRDIERQLQARFVASADILDEIREHLTDGVDGLQRLGHSSDRAQEITINRFGPAELVAEGYAADRWRTTHRALAVAAIVLGIAIAYVDSRPTWDDTGVTAAALMVTAGALGVAGPRHPLRWALLLGCWIPVLAFARSPSAASFSLVLVLVFPMLGGGIGLLFRRQLTGRANGHGQ